MLTGDCLLRLVHQKPFTALSGVSKDFMVKRLMILSFQSCLALSSSSQPYQGILSNQFNAVFDAAIKVAWSGFLHCEEFTLGSGEKFNTSVHLSQDSVTFFPSFESPTHICLNLPGSKTDPFRKGVSILISAAPGTSTCPVAVLKHFFQVDPQPTTSPLFSNPEGSPLSQTVFILTLKAHLLAIGVNSSQFLGHSFHHGDTSAAAAVDYSDHEIQLLGHWHSDAYKLYIDLSRDRILSLSACLHLAISPAQPPVLPALYFASALA